VLFDASRIDVKDDLMLLFRLVGLSEAAAIAYHAFNATDEQDLKPI